MDLKYKCTNQQRRTKEGHAVHLPEELVMDEKNIATIYCPKCKRQLKRIK